MRLNPQSILRGVMALFLAGAALRAPAQGSLTPPGPPAPTMKTLSQIEPRTPISSLPCTISNSGSYYLTTNLIGASGSDGIIVQASDVSIDLRGFALIGVAGSINGVNVSSAQNGLSIFGGVVRSWGADGVNAGNASSSEFSQLILSQNASHGLVAGTNSVVSHCVASGNAGDGLELTSACFAEANNCQTNTLCGLHVLGNACRVENNHFGGNGVNGLKVDGTQNLIIKNSAVNDFSFNFNIATNNDYGQIYTSPGTGFTNSNPWANFSSGTATPTCTDGIKNGAETDIDCGGGTCPACALGKACVVGTDCATGICASGVCANASCSDGIKDGAETDVDCGGGTCPACNAGKNCVGNSDCLSGQCSSGVCTASCSDGVKDGAETDVDCGGGTCPACATGKHCQLNTDCVTGACNVNTLTCVASQCQDGVKDGTETDIDCGGSCTPCATGKHCQLNTDCTSNACDTSSLTCVSSQCADHHKDGAETDIDCGGGTCATCGLSQHCQLDADCTSNACDGSSFLCVSNQCLDHRKDGTETDIDCGGSNACARCTVGQHCLVNSDCLAGHACVTGVCQ